MSRASTHVELVAYQEDWRRRFAETAAQIRTVLPHVQIEHVGSTSVVGLSSKDTIDTAVIVFDVQKVLTETNLDALAAFGFVHHVEPFAENPNRAFLARISEDHRTDHIHVLTAGSDAARDQLLFRDFLRDVPDAMHTYEAEKLALADRLADKRPRYVEEKQAIVETLMVEARLWADAR